MTDLRQAAQEALEALEAVHTDFVCRATHHKKKDQHGGLDICPNATRHITAITALRTALEQQAEPICPECKAAVLYECVACSSNNYPPQQQAEPAAQRPWVGLTDEDFLEACQIAEHGNYLVAFQRIQIKLKEKNSD